MHLTRRQGFYFFRKKVPVDLVAVYGKREIIYSLRTKERPIAARHALRAAVQFEGEFSLKRGEPAPADQIAAASDPMESAGTQSRAERPAPKANKVALDCLIPIWRRENNPTDKTADSVAHAVSEVATLTSEQSRGLPWQPCGIGGWSGTTPLPPSRKKVGFIRLLLTVARNRGHIESNAAEGMALRADVRAVELRQLFSAVQVRAILAATESYHDTESAKFWIPRLGYLTGARLNELCQLRTCDIVNKEGICGVQLIDCGEYMPGVPMTLKNAASRQWVPLLRPAYRLPNGPSWR